MAHRGASDHAPENTPAAFRRAVDAGADIIETDLWFTADDALVCHHDATAERMTGDRRRIDALTLAEVRGLVVTGRHTDRFPGERIPTLDALLALAPPDVVLALELKDPRFKEPADAAALVDLVADRIAARTVVFVSFHLARLRALKTACGDAAVGHITVRNPFPTQATEMLGPFWPLLVLNPRYVALAHRSGRWVAPLDPDPRRRLARYLRMGVDAVLTGDPAATRRQIERLSSP